MRSPEEPVSLASREARISEKSQRTFLQIVISVLSVCHRSLATVWRKLEGHRLLSITDLGYRYAVQGILL